MDQSRDQTARPTPHAGNSTRWTTPARWILIAAAALFIVFGFVFTRKGERSEWHTCYIRAARRMQAGLVIHRAEPVAYAYPPAMALLAVPFSWLDNRQSLAAWYALNVLATSIVFASAWRLTGGPPLKRLSGRWLATALLGTLLAGRFLAAPLENQQFDMVIAALLLVGCCRLGRGRDIAAGVWLGAAAAMKCTPLLFAPYLVYRGKFKAALLLVAVALALNGASDLVYPKQDGGSYLVDWTSTFLLKVARTAPGVWDSDLVLNQSLAGLINRLVQSGFPTTADRLPSALAGLMPRQVWLIRGLVAFSAAALVAVFAWRLGKPFSAPAAASLDSRPLPLDQVQTGIECAAVLCLMLLLSPMSSKAHYVVLLPACFLFARLLVNERRTWLYWLLPPLLATGPLCSKGLVGKTLGDLTLAWGLPTWFALLLLAVMCWATRARALQPRGDLPY
ncbi:MAG: glycosyltransferase family 87 protein [Pirellulales bacterium]